MRRAGVRQVSLIVSTFLCLSGGNAYAQAQRGVSSEESPVQGKQQADSVRAPSSATLNSRIASTVSVDELSVPPGAQKAFDKGRRLLLNEHRAEESLADLRKAVQIAPTYWEAHFLLGIAYMDLRKWSEAEHALARAISSNNGLGPAYLALGSCLLEEGNYTQAEERLLKGLELSPDAPHGQYDLSRTYYALGRLEQARTHVLKAIELEPARADAHFLLGNILLRLEDGTEAIAQLQQCIRLAPDSAFAALARDQISGLQSH